LVLHYLDERMAETLAEMREMGDRPKNCGIARFCTIVLGALGLGLSAARTAIRILADANVAVR
jgi:hypothetical protein